MKTGGRAPDGKTSDERDADAAVPTHQTGADADGAAELKERRDLKRRAEEDRPTKRVVERLATSQAEAETGEPVKIERRCTSARIKSGGRRGISPPRLRRGASTAARPSARTQKKSGKTGPPHGDVVVRRWAYASGRGGGVRLCGASGVDSRRPSASGTRTASGASSWPKSSAPGPPACRDADCVWAAKDELDLAIEATVVRYAPTVLTR